MERRYHLDKSSHKETCPKCEHKTFVRYIDVESKQYAPAHYGRCDRQDNCAYHEMPPLETKCYFMQFTTLTDYSEKAYWAIDKTGKTGYIPKSQMLERNGDNCWISDYCLKDSKFTYITNECKYFNAFDDPIPIELGKQEHKPPVLRPVSYFPVDLFKKSLEGYPENNFVKYLDGLFGTDMTSQLIVKYFIGSSDHKFKSKDFPGYESEPCATVFWQIDLSGKVRSGKIMLYNPETGKRIKEPFKHITWAHKLIDQKEYELRQCFFGEHLLRDRTKPVAIVESEKTAIIASAYLPQFLWLAGGQKNGLSPEKCKVLKGKNVVLFPDLKAYSDWLDKAKELSNIASFTVSDLLERKATIEEREQGLDIADYLVRYDIHQFMNETPIKVEGMKRQQSENNAMHIEVNSFLDGQSTLFNLSPNYEDAPF